MAWEQCHGPEVGVGAVSSSEGSSGGIPGVVQGAGPGRRVGTGLCRAHRGALALPGAPGLGEGPPPGLPACPGPSLLLWMQSSGVWAGPVPTLQGGGH